MYLFSENFYVNVYKRVNQQYLWDFVHDRTERENDLHTGTRTMDSVVSRDRTIIVIMDDGHKLHIFCVTYIFVNRGMDDVLFESYL